MTKNWKAGLTKDVIIEQLHTAKELMLINTAIQTVINGCAADVLNIETIELAQLLRDMFNVINPVVLYVADVDHNSNLHNAAKAALRARQ